MAENTIAQLEQLFQDLDLQISELEKLNLESIKAFGDVYTAWKELISSIGYQFPVTNQ